MYVSLHSPLGASDDTTELVPSCLRIPRHNTPAALQVTLDSGNHPAYSRLRALYGLDHVRFDRIPISLRYLFDEVPRCCEQTLYLTPHRQQERLALREIFADRVYEFLEIRIVVVQPSEQRNNQLEGSFDKRHIAHKSNLDDVTDERNTVLEEFAPTGQCRGDSLADASQKA